MSYRLTLFGNPITKKNSYRILRNRKTDARFIAPSSAYKNYEEACGYQIPHELKDKKINIPCNIQCVYYMKRKGKVDLCNLLNATCDILVKYGVIADDNRDIAVSHNHSIVLYDKENPRVEISITPLEGYKQWNCK